MTKYLLILWLSLLPLLVSAQDKGAVDTLAELLASIQYLQGDFVQRQYDDQQTMLVESKGRFRLFRPGYFAWEIQFPDSQLVIADPDFIWHLDNDLETVTRRPLASQAQIMPLQILGGDGTLLRDAFHVESGGAGVFILRPLSDDAGFKQLTLRLEQSRLIGMDIADNLGQSIAIAFSALDTNTVLTSADFVVTPPDGADLFYYDE